ncbi:MAG: hypothetical protein IPM29_11340 [Planctomycetes bacterium]|nr:hypothetical protein [Planctomycetota bacterium]
MKSTTLRIAMLGACVSAAMFAGCSNGGSGGGSPGGASNARLVKVEYGRLVDVYAYRRIDSGNDDRRDTRNRQPVLVLEDVVISPDIETQALFDSVGEARPDANYRFLPFDISAGHDELLILWDDRGDEGERFQAALAAARGGLIEVATAYRGQNVLVKPIPVVPRDAAFKLTFSADLGRDSSFFADNPAAIQVLLFRDDPDVVSPVRAFVPADTRIIAKGREVIVDTTILGGEASNSRRSTGLEPSADSFTANYRLAIPTSGVVGNLLSLSPDAIPEQNGVDAVGDPAVIRDFRSGNTSDGTVGALADFSAPAIVTVKNMDILSVDPVTRVVEIGKRGSQVAIRGRLPFVDGVIDADSGLPKGPLSVPTVDSNGNVLPLPQGDFVTQLVVNQMTGEVTRVRAEVIENLDVGVVDGDANFAGPGVTAGGTDGGELTVARVRLSSVSAFDSNGNTVTMQATAQGGPGCEVTVRYYEAVRYRQGGFILSDTARRDEFFVIEPAPVDANGDPLPPGSFRSNVQPDARFAIRFSEPLDTSFLSPLDNYLLTTRDVNVATFQDALLEPKAASLSFLQSDLIDKLGDGTVLQLSPRLGLFHDQGQEESYWFHVDVSRNGGVADLAGNRLDVYDRRPPGTTNVGGFNVDVPLQNFSIPFTLDAAADINYVGSRVFRFADSDEDGTVPGSIDFFGQFQLRNGVLSGAQVTRRKRTADSQNLGAIQRWDRGECVAPGNPMAVPPTPPASTPPPATATYATGALYNTPSMVAVQPGPPLVFQPPAGPQTFGGIVEPHTSRGARVQMTYREDDFGLSYHEASDLCIDVEQLHWAPWLDSTVLFDRFDRYTMTLGHSKKRPDLLYVWYPGDPMGAPAQCAFDCLSLYSGLLRVFADNFLENSQRKTVVRDKEYVINPNEAFRAASGVKYVPYPRFEDTYTWRDSRSVTWNMASDAAVGFGGAIDAQGVPPDGDRTASVSSPWITDDPDTAFITQPAAGWQYTTLVRDQADFLGDRTRDHDPIAVPLLVDISVWPDDTRQIVNAGNLFHIAYVGPIWTVVSPNGYYNAGAGITTTNPPDPFSCRNQDWPHFRVYTFGGPDPNNPGTYSEVDPDLALVATGGVIKDMGLGDPTYGLWQTKPGDSHLHWAQIDVVRRVSVVTYGFFDTLKPNQHALGMVLPSAPLPPAAGRPDLSGLFGGDVAVQDVIPVLDPPANQQPGGTSVEVEFRFAETFENDNGLYDPLSNDSFDGRKNLLNPNYACEAYRYASPNPGPVGFNPRVEATGLTPYVIVDDLDSIRNENTRLLPRFMNFRIIMENNVFSDPPVSPSLRGMAIVYRVARKN